MVSKSFRLSGMQLGAPDELIRTHPNRPALVSLFQVFLVRARFLHIEDPGVLVSDLKYVS